MVINNAGVVSGKTLLDIDDASIQRTFDVNIIAHFWVIYFHLKIKNKKIFNLGS